METVSTKTKNLIFKIEKHFIDIFQFIFLLFILPLLFIIGISGDSGKMSKETGIKKDLEANKILCTKEVFLNKEWKYKNHF